MLSRRGLLVGGGAGLGLVVAWAIWPRSYAPNLAAAHGEATFGAWLRIGRDGQVTVAVPQTEHGQGVYTTLPQIVADELGADWRTVGVEAAPVNPLYANTLAAQWLTGGLLPPVLSREHARRNAAAITAGSTSIRMFEEPLRDAGAAARVLLCAAAARRWGIDAADCDTAAGFVVAGSRRLRFADVAEAAAAGTLPDDPPRRTGAAGRIAGVSVPRLDAPAKVDGSATFAADIRLPDMVFASSCAGPPGGGRLVQADKVAADRVPGMLHVIEANGWVAAVGQTWWAADRGLAALAPRFEGLAIDMPALDAALAAALDAPGVRIAQADDPGTAFRGAQVFTATYRAAPAVHAALETPAATARWQGGRLELWVASDAPALARTAVARAADVSEAAVIVHPLMVGGSFGAALDHGVAVRAALVARKVGRPVQLCESRREALRRDAVRAPAMARMTARLGADGRVEAWRARIAAPATGHALAAMLMPGDPAYAAALAVRGAGAGDAYAVDGALPPYAIPALAIDHHPVATALPTGHLRGGAAGYTGFFTECFLDELAQRAGTDPLAFRLAMLGGNPRLARCLSTVAALGGWNGGVAGSGQGIAACAIRGSFIAVLAEARVEGDRVRVDRLVAAADCGRLIHPDIVRQQIEGGLIFGMATALGGAVAPAAGRFDPPSPGGLRLPLLADTPDIAVEIVASDAAPGGVAEIGVPAVAPAIANAVRAATGLRLRALPLRPGG